MTKFNLITSGFLLITINSLSYPFNTMPNSDPRLENKLIQLDRINTDIEQTTEELGNVIDEHNKAVSDLSAKKRIYDNSKTAYERASKNVDLIPGDEMVKILNDYKTAAEANNNAQKKEQQLSQKKNELESKIESLKNQRNDKHFDILEVKATIFDEEISTPVWAEGFGESILDEDKSMNECKKMALEYAQRDAMEKGGKMIIETLTKMEQTEHVSKTNFNGERVKKSKGSESSYSESYFEAIKSTAIVQIIDQDTTGDFGKIKRNDQGDVIKFSVIVRLKLKSVTSFNPFRERIKELKSVSPKQNMQIVRVKQPVENDNQEVVRHIPNKSYTSVSKIQNASAGNTKSSDISNMSVSNDNQNNDCLKSQIQGENVASAIHSTTGWFWGGYSSGVLLGLIGTGIVTGASAASNPQPKSIPPDVDRACFAKGFSKKAKSKNIWSSLGGGLLGTLTIVLIIVSATSE